MVEKYLNLNLLYYNTKLYLLLYNNSWKNKFFRSIDFLPIKLFEFICTQIFHNTR